MFAPGSLAVFKVSVGLSIRTQVGRAIIVDHLSHAVDRSLPAQSLAVYIGSRATERRNPYATNDIHFFFVADDVAFIFDSSFSRDLCDVVSVV